MKAVDLFNKVQAELADCPKVLELGTMFGDMLMAAPGPLRLGVEAHAPYINRGRVKYNNSIIYLHCPAQQAVVLFEDGEFDAVMMIDFPEHLCEQEAVRIVKEAKRIARKVIWFTPEGYHEQRTDRFNLGGDYWQTHRSEWQLDQVTALGFDAHVWHNFHRQDHPEAPHAIYGVWNK